MEPQTLNEYFEVFFPPTVALLITAFISVFIGLYLEKFKTRLVFLKYKLYFNALGTTIQNEFWGNIEVLYKGRQTNHLNFVTIEISNESNVDLENVNIDVWVDQESQILGHDANYIENGNIILLENNYYALYSDVLRKNQQDIEEKEKNKNHITPTQLINEVNWILTNKKFHLPILNRRNSIRINLLIENFKGEIPNVKVSVLHKSVKLVTQRDKAEEEKRLGINMIVWGLLIFWISAWFIHQNQLGSTASIILTVIIGSIQLLIGLVIYRVINLIRNILS